MAKLMVTRSGTNLGSWFIEDKRLVIGRAEGVDIRLEDAAVSKQHASIEVMGADHILLDLESSNGTFVNGTRVMRHLLRHGDAIDILGFELKYVDHKSVVVADGDRTMIFTRGAEGGLTPAGAGAGKAPLANARTVEVELPVAVLRGVAGPRAGGTIALDRPLTALGERGRDAAAVFRRPDGFALARVTGKPPKVDGKAIPDGWQILRDGAVIEVGGEKVELAYIAKH
ncbi:MAG TPA: FHA domain-containing protein [Burkholderiales bacterium]|nr:FHA domain-containing protein [Burkholderiales bacterium]